MSPFLFPLGLDCLRLFVPLLRPLLWPHLRPVLPFFFFGSLFSVYPLVSYVFYLAAVVVLSLLLWVASRCGGRYFLGMAVGFVLALVLVLLALVLALMSVVGLLVLLVLALLLVLVVGLASVLMLVLALMLALVFVLVSALTSVSVWGWSRCYSARSRKAEEAAKV